MRPRRRHERFIRRLEVEFVHEGKSFRAFSSDFSRYGIFIRTNRALVPGTELDINVHLPNNEIAQMRGLVRRAIKTPGVMIKNGMGIELIRRDETYIKFLQECDPAEQGGQPSGDGPKSCHYAPPPQSHLHPEHTARTGAHEKPSGHHHAPPHAPHEKPAAPAPATVILTCPSCGAKNRVLEAKMPLGPKCGRCKEPLISLP